MENNLEAFVTVSIEDDGFLATFFDAEDFITHDAFYSTEEEMRVSLADYINANQFELI